MVEFEGLDTIIEHLDKIIDAEKIVQGINTSCLLVEGAAKQIAPKDTGALRNSITSKVEQTSEAITGMVYTPLEYAPYVEYGTGLFAEEGNGRQSPWIYEDDDGVKHKTTGQHPQPFMRPALNENKQKIIEILKKAMIK